MHASHALLGPDVGRMFALAATNYVYEVTKESTLWVGFDSYFSFTKASPEKTDFRSLAI
jgi:hypothetical protein